MTTSLELAPVASDAQVLDVRASTNGLLAEAELLTITTDAEDAYAKTLLVQATASAKRIDALRRRFTDPLNAQVKSINADFAPMLDTAKEAAAILRRKTGLYFDAQRAEAERVALAAQRAAEAEQAQAAAKAAENGLPVPLAAVPLPTAAVPARSTVIGGARVTTREVWRFEVEDVTKLPAEYVVADEVAIGRAVRAGARSIPGVRIFSETTQTVRS